MLGNQLQLSQVIWQILIVILCCANIIFGLLQKIRKVNVFLSSAASRFMISLLDFVMKDFF